MVELHTLVLLEATYLVTFAAEPVPWILKLATAAVMVVRPTIVLLAVLKQEPLVLEPDLSTHKHV